MLFKLRFTTLSFVRIGELLIETTKNFRYILLMFKTVLVYMFFVTLLPVKVGEFIKGVTSRGTQAAGSIPDTLAICCCYSFVS